MAPPKLSPLAPPPPPPVVPPAPLCKLGERCHVNGKGLKTFGTKFPIAAVQKAASCSIALVADDVTRNVKDARIASGVLITPEVALFAAHSMQGLAKISILMDFECDAATAPAGMHSQHRNQWPACTSSATVAQGVEVKALEIGATDEFDYVMLLIKWNSPSPVKLPRIPVFPKMAFVPKPPDELLLVGHPDDATTKQGEPTQACAFKLVESIGPNPSNIGNKLTDDVYGFGEFNFTRGEGFSGGGVFNQQGELVGLLKGNGVGVPKMTANNFAFLNLGACSGKMMNDPKRGRLFQWLSTGNPLKPGDGGAATPPTFTT